MSQWENRHQLVYWYRKQTSIMDIVPTSNICGRCSVFQLQSFTRAKNSEFFGDVYFCVFSILKNLYSVYSVQSNEVCRCPSNICIWYNIMLYIILYIWTLYIYLVRNLTKCAAPTILFGRSFGINSQTSTPALMPQLHHDHSEEEGGGHLYTRLFLCKWRSSWHCCQRYIVQTFYT